MKRLIGLMSFGLLLLALALPSSTLADSSHIRIIRLSLVQGDVRFTQSFHKDPMTDSSAVWERAPLNLPIRQGYALSTDEGRAEVEFESGAMAFLNAHSVLEFYDLSLEDGSRTTRLVLRQGSATFYVNPSEGEYFSVTGGDFTVEANGRTEFRLDNFDDGSTVKVEKGHVSALLANKPTILEKGQSYTVNASDPKNPVLARLPDNDDFDSFVSSHIDTAVTATNYSNQYVNSSNYTSGFNDLYTYGSWYSLGGYDYGWRPFGAAFGWSPFSFGFGDWFLDPAFGWSFVGSAPWGWLPYHYGGWVFSPAYGWVWAPSGFGTGRPVTYRPVTAVFVHSGSTFGFVPAHPADVHGKTPLNIGQGVYSTQTRGTMATTTSGENWSVVKRAPVTALSGTAFAVATPPSRVVRTLPTSSTNRAQSISAGSSIVYDPSSHRFVNSNSTSAGGAAVARSEAASIAGTGRINSANSATVASPSASKGTSAAPVMPRNATSARPPMTPPPARTAGSASGGATWGGAAHSSSASMGAPHSSGSSTAAHSAPAGGAHR
jgi:FecR protein